VVAYYLAVRTGDEAGPAPRQVHDGPKVSDGFARGGGPYHFLIQARGGRRHQASAQPAASSIGRLRPRLPLAEDPYGLLFREPLPLHGPSLR